nr:hypothetical protein [Bradyrhizobium huanghuaihaiense]
MKAPFPGFVEPALASPIERVPSGARWIHEIKFDGYRVQVHLANKAVKIFTRRGHDWTNRFKKVADDAPAHQGGVGDHGRRSSAPRTAQRTSRSFRTN